MKGEGSESEESSSEDPWTRADNEWRAKKKAENKAAREKAEAELAQKIAFDKLLKDSYNG